MSAQESEESRWPAFATAIIRTHSVLSTVAQRSSSAIEGCASTRSASFGGGFGSGTGLRWGAVARLASLAMAGSSVWMSLDGNLRPDPRNERHPGPPRGAAAAPRVQVGRMAEVRPRPGGPRARGGRRAPGGPNFVPYGQVFRPTCEGHAGGAAGAP